MELHGEGSTHWGSFTELASPEGPCFYLFISTLTIATVLDSTAVGSFSPSTQSSLLHRGRGVFLLRPPPPTRPNSLHIRPGRGSSLTYPRRGWSTDYPNRARTETRNRTPGSRGTPMSFTPSPCRSWSWPGVEREGPLVPQVPPPSTGGRQRRGWSRSRTSSVRRGSLASSTRLRPEAPMEGDPKAPTTEPEGRWSRSGRSFTRNPAD